MKVFYGSRFSLHMTKTPEGFLICHSVPICRTGEQEYLPREIGVEEEKKLIITILKELRSQSEITGMWTNITDEDIEKADDTIQDPNEGMGDMDGLVGNAPSSPGNQGESGEDGKQDPLHGHGESAQTQKPQRTTDSWEEGKHPRGGNPNNTGQFSKAGGGKNSLKNSRNNGNVKTSRKSEHRPRAIKLPKEEYARVVSALNTNLTKEEREMPFLAKAIGDHLYFIRNRGFSDYVVLRRVKIK